MSRRTTVTRELIDAILAGRDRGLTQREIASTVGRSTAIVNAVLRGTHPACRLEAVRARFRSVGDVVREERDGSLLIRVPRRRLEEMTDGNAG